MKNKLLLTSALASSLIAGSSAIAQTTITGDLVVNYRTQSFSGAGYTTASDKAKSVREIGRESQLNVQNKGKLNVAGLDYAAGFSLEFDGQGSAGGATTPATERNTISNENLFIDLISGNTTFTIGVDHIQRNYAGATPQVTSVIDDINVAGAGTTFIIGAGTSEAAGIGLTQRVPQAGISLSAYYVPKAGSTGSYDAGATPNDPGRNSAYEFTLLGSNTFGVKGLTVNATYNKEAKSKHAVAAVGTGGTAGAAGANDTVGKMWGVGYNFGQFSIGYDRINDVQGAITSTRTEETTNQYGVTFAATKDITVGALMYKTTKEGDAAKERVKALQVGYNLGPVTAILSGAKVDNINYGANKDAEVVTARLSTKF
jgi:hypothetical protein